MRQTSTFALVLLLSVLLCGCGKVKTNQKRVEMQKQLALFKQQLPLTIPNTSMVCSDAKIDSDMLVITCTLPRETYKEALEENRLWRTDQDDRSLARMVQNLGTEMVNQLDNCGYGVKYVYVDRDNGNTLWVMKIDAKKLKQLRLDLFSGKVKPITLVERAQQEISQITFPQKIDDGVTAIGAKIEDGNLVYKIEIETDAEASQINSEVIDELKDDLLEGFAHDETLYLDKKDLVEEHMHIIYRFYNSRHHLISTIDLSPQEIVAQWDATSHQ